MTELFFPTFSAKLHEPLFGNCPSISCRMAHPCQDPCSADNLQMLKGSVFFTKAAASFISRVWFFFFLLFLDKRISDDQVISFCNYGEKLQNCLKQERNQLKEAQLFYWYLLQKNLRLTSLHCIPYVVESCNGWKGP